MSTLHFADEIVAQSDIDAFGGGHGKSDPKERHLAGQITESLTTDWDPRRYRGTHAAEVKDLLERKAKGQEVVVEEAAEPEKVVDLMEALQRSLDAARQQKKGTRRRKSA